jgi:hypothetical protein
VSALLFTPRKPGEWVEDHVLRLAKLNGGALRVVDAGFQIFVDGRVLVAAKTQFLLAQAIERSNWRTA